MTRLLAAHGKKPEDLRFANAQSSSGAGEIEIGVFQVRGLGGPALLQAIVASSRPNAPGLSVSKAALAGKPVTQLVYTSGLTLYLYAHGNRVFYVGTQNEKFAATTLRRLP